MLRNHYSQILSQKHFGSGRIWSQGGRNYSRRIRVQWINSPSVDRRTHKQILETGMKFKTKDFGIVSGLAASALLVSHHNETGKADIESVVEADGVQAFESRLIFTAVETEIEDASSAFHTVAIPHQPEWDQSSASRFSELAGQFAIQGKLNESDSKEYANLKSLRRRTNPSRSFDEIVADHELHIRVAEAIKSLRTLVDYATTTYPSAAQETRS